MNSEKPLLIEAVNDQCQVLTDGTLAKFGIRASGQEIWFAVTPTSLSQLIAHLNRLAEQMATISAKPGDSPH